jgi:hypothetical protein
VAGHEPLYEPFICTQLARQGLWDERPLLQRIENQEFPLIVLTWNAFQQPADPERFSKSFASAITRSYEIERALGRFVIYRPKAARGSALPRTKDMAGTPGSRTDTVIEANSAIPALESTDETAEIPIRAAT